MRKEPEILLAEDNETDVLLMERALKDAQISCKLRVVRDGQAAIDFLSGLSRERSEGSPSVVILDLQMPRRGGQEVLEWMKRDDGLRCIPVIIFSSSGLARDVEPAYACGANAYIVKPASIKERAQVAEFIAEWTEVTKAPLAVTHGVADATAFMQSWLATRRGQRRSSSAN